MRSRGSETDVAAAVVAEGRVPMKIVAETIGVSRSQLHAKAAGASKPRGRDRKGGDDDLRPVLLGLVDARPAHG